MLLGRKRGRGTYRKKLRQISSEKNLGKAIIDGDELDRIGQLGETHFTNLCLLAKLKGSKVEPDKTGKDFVVETPLDTSDPNLSVDKRPPPLQVVAQVKTILSKNDTVRVALSVAERLAKDLRPVVICVFRIGLSGVIGEMAFVHLLNDQLEKVLKALRGVHARDVNKLHKKTITFRIPAEAWTPASFPEFFATIKSLAPNGMLSYGQEKQRQLEELGFDENRYSMKFSLIGTTPEQLADGFLGLIPLAADKIVLAERRFDILKPVDEGEGRGTIYLEPEATERATLRLISSSVGEAFETSCELITIGPALLGERNFAIRCNTTFFDVIITDGKLRFKFPEKFSEENKNFLDEWRDFFCLIKLISSDSFVLTIQLEERKKLLRFPVEKVIDARANADAKRYVAFLDRLRTVLSAADLLEKTFSLSEVRRQLNELFFLSRLLASNSSRFSAVAEYSSPPKLRDERSAYISAIDILGSWVGLYFPLTVSTKQEGIMTKWIGDQTSPALMEKLDGEKLEASFDRFRVRMTSVSGVNAVLIQEPGSFMLNFVDCIENSAT